MTDDPETPGRGGWEINLSYNIERTADERVTFAPLLDVNYGLLENDQWKIEFPVVYVDPETEEARWGAGDIEVGWKYRFQDEQQGTWMASIYPQLLIPTADDGGVLSDGSEETALGDGATELFVPVEIGRHFCDERLLVYGELGYNIVLGGQKPNEWAGGVPLERAQSQRLELLLELAAVVAEGKEEPDYAFFNGGWKLQLDERWSFIGAVGRSFRQRRSGVPDLLLFVGFQLTTPGPGGDQETNSGQQSMVCRTGAHRGSRLGQPPVCLTTSALPHCWKARNQVPRPCFS